jgi:hypothetical protein
VAADLPLGLAEAGIFEDCSGALLEERRRLLVGERLHVVEVLSVEAQALAARHEQDEPGAAPEQVGKRVRAREEMLDVVRDD